MALPAPNWLALPETRASETEGRSELDIAMHGPWFLGPDGVFSRDCSVVHDVAELMAGQTSPCSDAANFFVQSASTFAMILKYLPNVPLLSGNYKRHTDGMWIQIKDLYFVVENINVMHSDGWQAAGVYLAVNDPWLTIQVAPSREEAEKLIEKQIVLHHRASPVRCSVISVRPSA
ncbi:hypothetical protein B0H14DRAFT_3439410 [Mycena olivaceomarginata]|nr:hypothetical protein B0H14DRAFT_3439410 [Mycena olivaceomarginata]